MKTGEGNFIKKFSREFENFVLRGNVMDMSVGVITGAAFGAIVKSLTEDIISPLIGLFAKTDFNTLHVTLLGVDVHYSSFITAVINFVIMTFLIFMLIKMVNNLSNLGKHNEQDAPTTKKCPYCLSEIPLEATRCAHCTSEIASTEAQTVGVQK